jgi:hypothetical protein
MCYLNSFSRSFSNPFSSVYGSSISSFPLSNKLTIIFLSKIIAIITQVIDAL